MSPQPGRGRRAAAGAVLAVELLAGCRGGPTAAPRPDQVVVAYPSTLTTFHPTLVSDEFSYSIASNVFEPLVDVGARQGLRPGLAVAWHNLDDLTWRFELRADAAFHDGRRVDAARVVAALERARLDPALRMTFVLDPVERFSAVGDGTVEVRTRFPMPDLSARLIELGVWEEPWTPEEPPQGSGPYRVASWRPQGDVVLERVSGGGPRRLVFRAIPRAAERLAALRRGEVDLVAEVPAGEVAALRRDGGLRVVESRGLRVLFLGMDCESRRRDDVSPPGNPFREARVRQAVALAIDRRRLVSGPLGGFAEVLDQPLAPEAFGYAAGLPEIAYDPQEARRLLAEAGFPRGFATALDFVPGKYRDVERVVESIVADLGRVGIRVTPRPATYPEWLARLERRDSPLYLRGWSTSASAAQTYDYLLRTPASGYGSANAGGYSNPELDAVLEATSRESVDAERLAALQQAAEIIRRDLPVVPLYRQVNLYAVRDGLAFEPRLDRTVRGVELAWR